MSLTVRSDCDLYTPGHRPHFIPVLRIYLNAPRRLLRVLDLSPDGWLTLLDGDAELRWWEHDPRRMAALLTRSPGQLLRVGDTTFVTDAAGGSSFAWSYCGLEATPCRRWKPPSGRGRGGELTPGDLLDAARQMGGFTGRVRLDEEPDAGG